uniref:Uncharacterized protein n=1 Tax=Anguilla anguilla TaxID=7936 RepID=A0A0E9VFS7_ANGAN
MYRCLRNLPVILFKMSSCVQHSRRAEECSLCLPPSSRLCRTQWTCCLSRGLLKAPSL